MTGFTRRGIWLPAFGFDLSKGRCTMNDFLMMSCAGTASSNSNARTSVNNSAFILQRKNYVRLRRRSRKGATDSTSENRYPMHERGPPKNVIMLPHTPGSAAAASGVFSQRSGLQRNEFRQ